MEKNDSCLASEFNFCSEFKQQILMEKLESKIQVVFFFNFEFVYGSTDSSFTSFERSRSLYNYFTLTKSFSDELIVWKSWNQDFTHETKVSILDDYMPTFELINPNEKPWVLMILEIKILLILLIKIFSIKKKKGRHLRQRT